MPSVGFEPTANRLCLPATPFDAPFGFVVWTFSSPRSCGVCCQVSTPSGHETGLARDHHSLEGEKASPNLTDSTKLS